MKVLFLMLLLTLSGCSSTPVRTSNCDYDAGLLVDIRLPERPTGRVTNGQMADALAGLMSEVRQDNARKAQLRRQLGLCN